MSTTTTSTGVSAPPTRRQRVTKAQRRTLAVEVIAERRAKTIHVSPVIVSMHPEQDISAAYEWGPSWEEGIWILRREPGYRSVEPYIKAVRARVDSGATKMEYRTFGLIVLDDAMDGIAPPTVTDRQRVADALTSVTMPEPSLEAAVDSQLQVIMGAFGDNR